MEFGAILQFFISALGPLPTSKVRVEYYSWYIGVVTGGRHEFGNHDTDVGGRLDAALRRTSLRAIGYRRIANSNYRQECEGNDHDLFLLDVVGIPLADQRGAHDRMRMMVCNNTK